MKRFRTLSICAAAAVLALGMAACSSSGGGTEKPADNNPPATSEPAGGTDAAPAPSTDTSPAPAPADTSSAPAPTGTSSTSTPSGSDAFDFQDECIDEHKNISLYALTELKGWQVATLLDQLEYTWEYSDANTWTREYDGAAFRAVKESGAYTIDTYNEMNEKGGCLVGVAYSVVAGYPDAQSALSGNARCVIEDSYFRDDGSGIAIFYGPSMKEYLVIVTPFSESTALFTVFSQEAVGSGSADELLNIETGGSFQALWDKYVAGM